MAHELNVATPTSSPVWLVPERGYTRFSQTPRGIFVCSSWNGPIERSFWMMDQLLALEMDQSDGRFVSDCLRSTGYRRNCADLKDWRRWELGSLGECGNVGAEARPDTPMPGRLFS